MNKPGGSRLAARGSQRPIAIVGPTASGKTGVSIALAERLPIEIVSMDSRQLYREMDVGTAKPTPEERGDVPHHGFDLVSPAERFSAAEFARRARRWIREIEQRGRVPVLVGGTGFFLRALTDPIFRQPEMEPERRARLREWLDALPAEELHGWLAALDPPMAERYASWGGRQRVMRALELPLLTGRPLSWYQRHAPPEAEPIRPLTFVIERPREELNRRIEERVGEMVRAGLLDEARTLLDRYGADAPGLRAHGYMEIVPHLRGKIPLADALEQVVIDTRQYARRQMTWFRGQLGEDAIWLDGTKEPADLAEEIHEAFLATRDSRLAVPDVDVDPA